MIRSLVLVALLAVASPVAASDNSTITKFCMAAFKAAMAQAGKTAPEGMGAETCQCFLREVEQWAGDRNGAGHLQDRGCTQIQPLRFVALRS